MQTALQIRKFPNVTQSYVRPGQFGCYKNLYAVSPIRMLQKPICGQPSSDATKTYIRSAQFGCYKNLFAVSPFLYFFTFCQITEN